MALDKNPEQYSVNEHKAYHAHVYFDELVAVIFNEDFTVKETYRMP